MDNTSIAILLAVAAGVGIIGFSLYLALRPKPAPPAPLAPEPLIAAAPSPAPPQAYTPADPGYELMILLDRHAKSRAGNRVIDGAAEAMADDTVAALVRGASSAKGGQPVAAPATPAPAPAPPNG